MAISHDFGCALMSFGGGNHDNAKGRLRRTEEQLDHGDSLRLDIHAFCRNRCSPAFTGVNVASLRGESSNQLFETLEEWNDYLGHNFPRVTDDRHTWAMSPCLRAFPGSFSANSLAYGALRILKR